MKKFNLILWLILSSIACDREKFAELNTNPSTIGEPDLKYSTTIAIEEMYNNDYTWWFYNIFDYLYPWCQITTVGGSNSANFNVLGAIGSQNIYSGLFPQTRDIRHRIDQLPESEKAKWQSVHAITFPIQIGPALTNADLTGSIVYSEAGLGPYTNPPYLTPKYDEQSTLYQTWLQELDASIAIFSKADEQISLGEQDFIYHGNLKKWIKYCNLLKLKIAARLIHKNRSEALQIAASVGQSTENYMNTLSDDFIFKPNVNYHGSGEGVQPGMGSKTLIEFFVRYQDPRLRFLFLKNEFNPEVIQAFIDSKNTIPPFIDSLIVYDAEGNFDHWKSPGEPWVRYFGVPISPDENQKVENKFFFDQNNTNRIKINGKEKAYQSTSSYLERIVRTQNRNYNFIYPTKPGGQVIRDNDIQPPLAVILGSAAETMLYLAEFKYLGAQLPLTAQEYFNLGVELSIQRANLLAKNNDIPYYENDPVYSDPTASKQGGVFLRETEIESYLNQDICNLQKDALEKIYIQQYINFMNTPHDVWTTVRRSGIPKKESLYLPWIPFLISGTEMKIPRRFNINTPTKDHLNFENITKTLQAQNITSGTTDPNILNTERLWFDTESPAYGAGPK